MATHDRGASATRWAPTRPAAEALATRPAEPWQPSMPAWQHTRPLEIGPAAKPASKGLTIWPADPADPANAATSPAQATPRARAGGMAPAAPKPTGRSAAATLAASMAASVVASGGAAAPINLYAGGPSVGRAAWLLPARHPAPKIAAPAAPRPVLNPPRADGHWQVSGQPGEHLVLMPGQMHLGQQVASVRTLLGSCVAITLWHPKRRIGGMCHFLLPQRQRRAGDPLEGRYGDEAVEAMVKSLQLLRADPHEFVAHLYGGADTLSGCNTVKFNIGERNIEQAWSLIDRYGFQLDGVDVGEDIPRVVSLVLGSGKVTMRRGSGKAPDHLRDDPGDSAASPYAQTGLTPAPASPSSRRT